LDDTSEMMVATCVAALNEIWIEFETEFYEAGVTG
jgi:hypothetical protein